MAVTAPARAVFESTFFPVRIFSIAFSFSCRACAITPRMQPAVALSVFSWCSCWSAVSNCALLVGGVVVHDPERRPADRGTARSRALATRVEAGPDLEPGAADRSAQEPGGFQGDGDAAGLERGLHVGGRTAGVEREAVGHHLLPPVHHLDELRPVGKKPGCVLVAAVAVVAPLAVGAGTDLLEEPAVDGGAEPLLGGLAAGVL